MKNHSKLFSALLLFLVFLFSVFVFMLDNASASASSMHMARDEIRQQLSLLEGALMETRISGWAKIDNGEAELPELQAKAQKVLALFGDDVQAKVHLDETKNYRQVKVTAWIDSVDYTIHLYNNASAKDLKSHTYIVAEALLNNDSIIHERRAYEKLMHVLGEFHSSPILGTTYIAAIPGKMKNAEMEQTGRMLFAGLNADITELSCDNDWISLTGFSKQLGGGLDSVNGRFNLNIALRCHSHENKTLIYLGTPVISIPY